MAKKKITELVSDITAPFLAENQLELYHCEFLKEGKDWFLRVYIDKTEECEEEYVSTDDCEKVSRFLSSEMDRLDPIEQNYYLEVSSPGMDRELISEKHFERYAGKLVDVNLYKAVNGQKFIQAELVGLVDGNIVVKDEKNNEMQLEKSQVSKVRLAVIF